MKNTNLFVLGIGKVAFTTTGNSQYFSVYEEWKDSECKMALCDNGTTIFGCMDESILGEHQLIAAVGLHAERETR